MRRSAVGGISAGVNVRPQVRAWSCLARPTSRCARSPRAARVAALYLAAKGDRDFVPRLAAATRTPHKAVVLPGYEHGVQLVAASARARTLIETFLRTH